jgi:hypothetical protein
MRRFRLTIIATALLACGLTTRADEPIDLKVLYAGHPGSDREKDFVAFLGRHFVKVGTADYRTFAADRARGYDVVVLDWTSIYPRDKDGKVAERITRMDSPTPPKLPEGYDRPTVLIGAAAGYVTMTMSLKINWL